MTLVAPALGLAWAGLVLTAAVRFGPPPGRVRSLSVHAPASEAAGRRGPLEALGSLTLRLARRSQPSPERARLVGAATLATVMAVLLHPALVPVPGLVAWALPRATARRDERRRLRRLEADLPETVDLLTLAVGAGCNVALAVAAAGRRGTGPLAAELRRLSAEVSRGRRLADALDDLPTRAGEAVRPLAAALAGCERYGAPLVPTLELISAEVRRQGQRRAEEAARAVPVLLLFPLVLCILPAFALLTVGPLIAGALAELRL